MTLFDDDDPVLDLTVPAVAATRVRLTVAYDGAPFSGFAINQGVTTVAGVLSDAIEKVVGHPVELTCAGRTDRGVHAVGQVITFDTTSADLDLAGLVRRVNYMLAPSVAVRDPVVVPGTFDARFSAVARRYRYLILADPIPNPFLVGTTWHIEKPLDLYAMQLACDPFIGLHDFSSFCRRPKDKAVPPTLERRVVEAGWHDDGHGLLRFEIEASAFCHQMVRSIVGTIVRVGLGKGTAGQIAGIIRARDRVYAGDLAPAAGLTLLSVRYRGWSS